MMNNEYMKIAIEKSAESIDPNTQVGCIIVKDNRIVSQGCNCLPRGLKAENYPLHVREGEYYETKYPFVLHSEAMAIAQAEESLVDSIMYVTLFPCNECAKLIIQAQIKEIYYLEDKYAQSKSVMASKRMLDDANVKYIQLNKDEVI